MRFIFVYLLIVISGSLKSFAQGRIDYKDFKKIKTEIKCQKKSMGYEIKTNGSRVELEITVGKKETIAVFLNDSLCAYDSITRLDRADFDFGTRFNIPNPKKKYTIYVYLEKSKTYLLLPYKRKYFAVRIYEPIKGVAQVRYSNSIR